MTTKMNLIQRGTFNNNLPLNKITGFDSICQLHYMGAAEYECGALPKSLKRIVKNSDSYEFKKTKGSILRNYKKENLIIYYSKNNEDSFNIEEYINLIKKNAKGNHYTKLSSGLEYYLRNNLDENTFDFSWTKLDTVNFWWDIENDLFFFFGESKQEQILKMIECLHEKWKDELFPQTKKHFF